MRPSWQLKNSGQDFDVFISLFKVQALKKSDLKVTIPKSHAH